MSSHMTKYIGCKILAFYSLIFKEFHMTTHTHDRCEIMYVVRGNCSIHICDEIYKLSQKQFVFIDANVPHRLDISHESECAVINLEFAFTNDQASEKSVVVNTQPLRQNCPAFSSLCNDMQLFYIGKDTENFEFSLKDLLSLLKNKNTSTSHAYLAKLLFERVLIELSLCYQNKKDTSGVYYLQEACKYIRENITEEMKITDIASAIGISRSYLQLLFSKYKKMPITDYINQTKIEQSIFLLVNSTLPITDIAIQVGYNNRQHFSNTFRKIYNCSPGKYRMLHGKTNLEVNQVDRIVFESNGEWIRSQIKGGFELSNH